ncbi:hypothetical protein AVEN_14892-1 [Araneus ventricosus]|uniref:Uncharacterized protein n=1 Tax=Araneus ventricosus TaxID=182803 RepID=A0A4Y2F9I3_ARAVE|nr:hypothetical protein AVEN_14892-1 [Araneus ventricosus]
MHHSSCLRNDPRRGVAKDLAPFVYRQRTENLIPIAEIAAAQVARYLLFPYFLMNCILLQLSNLKWIGLDESIPLDNAIDCDSSISSIRHERKESLKPAFRPCEIIGTDVQTKDRHVQGYHKDQKHTGWKFLTDFVQLYLKYICLGKAASSLATHHAHLQRGAGGLNILCRLLTNLLRKLDSEHAEKATKGDSSSISRFS